MKMRKSKKQYSKKGTGIRSRKVPDFVGSRKTFVMNDTQELILSYSMYKRTLSRTLLSGWSWFSVSTSNLNFSLKMSHWHRAEITEKEDHKSAVSGHFCFIFVYCIVRLHNVFLVPKGEMTYSDLISAITCLGDCKIKNINRNGTRATYLLCDSFQMQDIKVIYPSDVILSLSFKDRKSVV